MRSHAILGLLSASLAAPLAAQSSSSARAGLSAGASALRVDHELLGHALAGGGARLLLPRGDGAVTWRLGLEWSRGEAGRFHTVCVGFVPDASACPPEPLRDRARAWSATAGPAFRMLGTPRLAVAITTEVTLTDIRVDTRGLASGDSVWAAKTLWGPWLGVATSWSPSRRLPLALELDGAAGVLRPVVRVEVYDGYAPFEEYYGATRARLGVAWRPWRERAR